jgi:putative ABC transport system permease protein
MSYTLATLWFDRQRYIPGVLAVAFSALLIALQCGLLLGLFSVTSIPIDRAKANIWVGPPKVLSVDVAQKMSEGKARSWLEGQPEVDIRSVEPYICKFANWTKPNGGVELCIIIGSRMNEDSLGTVPELTPELRMKLTEQDTIVVDESELERLDLKKVGDTAEILEHKVRLVGTVKGMKSIAGPYIFCSMPTARRVLRYSSDETIYVLARCHDAKDAIPVVHRLADEQRQKDEHLALSVFTKEEFSLRSRVHWLTKTKAGIALGYAALLGLMVGAVVTIQTLYGATMASMREYATLLALGIPRWRLGVTVVTQAFWIGVLGIILSWPVVFLLAEAAGLLGVKPQLPIWLLGGAAVVTLIMAIGAGSFALRAIKRIEPVNLLR